jgi:hypothetical protein
MKKIAAILCVIILFTECKKKEEAPETPTPVLSNPTPPVKPNFFVTIPSDADGVLNASRVPVTFSNNFTTKLGKATAFFYTAPQNYTYVDAGTVSCNDSVLVKQSGGSYSYSGKAVNGQPESGILYTAGSTWSVSGTSSVPSFTFMHSVYPTDATITSATTFTRTAPYTVTYSGVTNADSVVIFFGCDSTLIQKTVSAASGSYAYSAAEVGSVKKKNSGTKGYFSFMPYKLISNTVSSKKYYFLNSTTATYTVTIQ